jgi:hypothetical protein
MPTRCSLIERLLIVRTGATGMKMLHATDRPAYYRTVRISDVHLGFSGCNAEFLLDFLRSTRCDQLYLVGDIIDIWCRSFAARNASTVLKTLRKRGLPEKESGLTGPMVMNEYWRLLVSKAECGSRNSW